MGAALVAGGAAAEAAGLAEVVVSVVEDHPVTGNTENVNSKDTKASHNPHTPKWINKYLSNQSIRSISQLVQEIESKTAAEIVPMIVLRSSVISHVPIILTLLFLLIFIPLEMYYLNWSDFLNLGLGISALLAYVISLYLSRIAWFQRVFTANSDESLQVWNRAEIEFYRQKINQTENRAGVLLFVSIMERKAVLLTDESVHRVLPDNVWSEILREFSTNLRNSAWEDGFVVALKRCGELLSEKFPSKGAKARNELANFLRIKE